MLINLDAEQDYNGNNAWKSLGNATIVSRNAFPKKRVANLDLQAK